MRSSGQQEHVVMGDQLRRARETIQFRPDEVAERLNVSVEEIGNWEAGRSQPSLRQLEMLAQLYGREIDYFLKETPEPPERLQFRSPAQRTFQELSSDARLVIARFDELCRTAFELEQLLGKGKHSILVPKVQHESPADLARDQRRALGFDKKPVRTLREQLSARGVRIFELIVPPGQFSGLSYWHSQYGPCILINAKELPGRRYFTLAHEYGHLLYHHQPSVCDLTDEWRPGPSAEERSANVFAIEFLLPAGPIREDFQRRGLSGRPTIQDVGKMAGRWQVSVQAMAYRLQDLGLLERAYADELLSAYQPLPRRIRTPKTPTWERRLGKAFVSSAIEAYREGHISLGKLARCLGLPLRKALETAESDKKKRH
ncbi:MAG: helix-turn-helix domain-containing protein [Candidatus Binatia bacterium]